MATTMHLVLDTNGLLLSKRNGCFHMATRSAQRMVAPVRVESIVVNGACRLTSDALLLAQEHGIPVIFLDGAGRPKARIWSTSHTHSAAKRRAQAVFTDTQEATAWCVDLCMGKLQGQLANLRWLERHRASNRPKIKATGLAMEAIGARFKEYRALPLREARPILMGMEGSIARLYWGLLGNLMPTEHQFPERSRRPAKDPFNALLNYGYGMLYAHVESVILRIGLDPTFGVLHTDGHGRQGLTYDLVEPFRPWVDRLILEGCLLGHHPEANFQAKGEGIWLGKAGKRVLIPAFVAMLQTITTLDAQRARRNTLLLRTIREFGDRMCSTREEPDTLFAEAP